MVVSGPWPWVCTEMPRTALQVGCTRRSAPSAKEAPPARPRDGLELMAPPSCRPSALAARIWMPDMLDDQANNMADPPPKGDRDSLLAGRRRFALWAAAAVLLLGGTGTAFLVHKPGSKTHAEAVAYCGLVACSVLHSHPEAAAKTASPGPGHAVLRSISASPTQSQSSPAPTSAAASPPPAPTRTPAPQPGTRPTPAPAPTATTAPVAASAGVSVTYSMPQYWFGGFQGELTVLNQTGSAISGWQIMIALPGDRVFSAWNADWQPDGGHSLIMTAAPYDQVIEPGASVSAN